MNLSTLPLSLRSLNMFKSSKCFGQLEELVRATTMATLLYAAPAWWGFASEGDRGRVERFIGRLRQSGYLPKEAPTAAEMVNEAEARLFRSVRCDNRHVLKKYLPPPKVHKYNLRMRPHNLTLPPKDDRNFIARQLYKNIYWSLVLNIRL